MKKIVLMCEGSIADNIKTLKRYTITTDVGASTNTEYLFYGNISEKSFYLTPTSSIKNSYKPSLVGEFFIDDKKRTYLAVKTEIHLLLRIFFIILFIHFIALECFFVFAKYVLLKTITMKMFVIPLLVIFVLFLFMIGGYFTGKKSALDKLQFALFKGENNI